MKKISDKQIVAVVLVTLDLVEMVLVAAAVLVLIVLTASVELVLVVEEGKLLLPFQN